MILLLGPTGGGKSVQGTMLGDRHHWRWLSTGELLRGTNDPEILNDVKIGKMISDEVVNKLVFAEIADNFSAGEERKIILDGYPREVKQAEALSRHEFDRLGREPVDIVIDVRMTKKEIMKRLALRGRVEDSPEIIESRLKLHDEQTQPLKDYYKSLGVPVSEVDGVGSVGEVHDRIEKILEDRKVVGAF
jgi:adenylate kinase